MRSIFTREELLNEIANWKAAYSAASTGKSYSIAGRSLTRQDLPLIREQLAFLQREMRALTTGSSMQKRQALVRR